LAFRSGAGSDDRWRTSRMVCPVSEAALSDVEPSSGWNVDALNGWTVDRHNGRTMDRLNGF
jgi:hypothetical protein